MDTPGQSSEVHTILPEVQVLQGEKPVRPDPAYPSHNQPLPLEHYALAPGFSLWVLPPKSTLRGLPGYCAVPLSHNFISRPFCKFYFPHRVPYGTRFELSAQNSSALPLEPRP
jgi:hypothetical protein